MNPVFSIYTKYLIVPLIFRFKTRCFVVISYWGLFNTFKRSIIVVIPVAVIKIVHKTTFPITAECKISTFATMMLTKKEEV